MQLMATRKTKADDEQPKKPNRRGVPLHVYLPPELSGALDAFAAANRRKVTAEVIMALEAHLKAGGFWPPKSADSE